MLFQEIKICGTEMDDCSEFATCSDTQPGIYECTCNEGYTGDGKTCSGEKWYEIICFYLPRKVNPISLLW